MMTAASATTASGANTTSGLGQRRGADGELYALFFLIIFCIFIILIVSFSLPGVYFLNTVHQTFHFQVLCYGIS